MNCLNGQKYLKHSIASVINQEYQNWELIFIDNNSKDKSKKIFKSIKDKRLKYFFLKKTLPLYQARNIGLKKASGKYISFLDTDDLWKKNKLKIQVKMLEKKIYNIYYSNYNILKINKYNKAFSKIMPSGYIFNELSKNYFIPILTVIFNKKILNKYNLKFDNRYNIIGDFDLFYKVSKKLKYGYIHESLATYRIHSNNFSYLNTDMFLKEYIIWIEENKKKISRIELRNILLSINFLKIKIMIFNSKFKLALYELIKFPFSIKKIKLILYFFLPKKYFRF